MINSKVKCDAEFEFSPKLIENQTEDVLLCSDKVIENQNSELYSTNDKDKCLDYESNHSSDEEKQEDYDIEPDEDAGDDADQPKNQKKGKLTIEDASNQDLSSQNSNSSINDNISKNYSVKSYAKSLHYDVKNERNLKLEKPFHELYLNCLKFHSMFLSAQPFTEYRCSPSYFWLYFFFELIEMNDLENGMLLNAFNVDELDESSFQQICSNNDGMLQSRSIASQHFLKVVEHLKSYWPDLPMKCYYILLTHVKLLFHIDVTFFQALQNNFKSSSIFQSLDDKLIRSLFGYLIDNLNNEKDLKNRNCPFKVFLSSLYLSNEMKFSYNYTLSINSFIQSKKKILLKPIDILKMFLLIRERPSEIDKKVITDNLINEYFNENLNKETDEFNLINNIFSLFNINEDKEFEIDYNKSYKDIAEQTKLLNLCCCDLVYTYHDITQPMTTKNDSKQNTSNSDVKNNNYNDKNLTDIVVESVLSNFFNKKPQSESPKPIIDETIIHEPFYLGNFQPDLGDLSISKESKPVESLSKEKINSGHFPIYFEKDNICKIFNFLDYDASIVEQINDVYLNNVKECYGNRDETVINADKKRNKADFIRFSHSEITFLYYFVLNLNDIIASLAEHLKDKNIKEILTLSLNLYTTRVPCQRCTVNLGLGLNFLTKRIVNLLGDHDIEARCVSGIKIMVGYSKVENEDEPLGKIKLGNFIHNLHFISSPFSIMKNDSFEDLKKISSIRPRTIFMSTRFSKKDANEEVKMLFLNKLKNAVEKWDDLQPKDS